MSTAVFIDAVRAQKIKRFDTADENRALGLMVNNDPDGERLWLLVSQASIPEAIDGWVWRAAQERLKAVVGEKFDPAERDATALLNTLGKAFAQHLRGKENQKRKAAENWLRIGVCWLVEKRSLQPWVVAESLLSIFFHDNKDAARSATRCLQKGRPNEFKSAIAMAALGQEMINAARSQRDCERQSSAVLRQQLADASSLIEDLRTKIEHLEKKLDHTSEDLRSTHSQWQDERHHWGHDLSETKAQQRLLLGERVAPLLSDAVDALEIEPPAPQIALKRLKAVLSIVEGAKS